MIQLFLFTCKGILVTYSNLPWLILFIVMFTQALRRELGEMLYMNQGKVVCYDSFCFNQVSVHLRLGTGHAHTTSIE